MGGRGDSTQSGAWPWAQRPRMESHGHCRLTPPSPPPARRPLGPGLPAGPCWKLRLWSPGCWKTSPMPRSGRPGVLGDRAGGRPWAPVPHSGEWPVGSPPWSFQAPPGGLARRGAVQPGPGRREQQDFARCLVSASQVSGVWGVCPALPCLCPRPPPQHVSLSCGHRLSPGTWVSPGSVLSSAPRWPPAVPAMASCE